MWRTPAFQECDAVPFKELPRWAKSAADAGVRSLVLNRWSAGGQGSAIPRFDPDPRLGTREEFAEAIRRCHALGVKVAVVVNLPPTSQLTGEFKAELNHYACQDRWGIPYTSVGTFQASPLTGGFGAGERRVWLNPGHPDFRRSLVNQASRLAEMGVDGVHFQDFFARPLDFNPTAGRTPDRATWEGGLDCMGDILQTCRAIQPGFALSTDALWDRPLSLSQVGSGEGRDISALHTAFPFWQPTHTLTDEDSFSAVNNALRNRARLRIAPSDGQPLGGKATAGITNYLRAVLAAREILGHTLLEGEIMATHTAQIQGATKWTVFRNPNTGLRSAVIMNTRAEPMPIRFNGFVPPGDNAVRMWLPSQGTRKIASPIEFEIPGRCVAILTEEAAADELPVAAKPNVPARNERVVFDLASSEDLDGWTLTGSFSVSTVAGLIPKPTLNSLAMGGEMATGTALSPTFTVGSQFDHLEVLLQGGVSEMFNGHENLVLRIIDGATNEMLEQLFPPGIHELRFQRVGLDKLKGRNIRIQLVDENRNASFAWIGLRKVALVGPTAIETPR